MAKRPTTSTLTNTASPTYLTQLNQNFTNVRNQFDNTLSLDGSTPNAMNADIDLNGNDLINANSVNTASLRIGGQAVVASDAVNQTVKKEFETVALLLADTGTYTNYAVDDYLRVVDGGFVYKVAASGASDHDITTAGGVKLYTQAGVRGFSPSNGNILAAMAPRYTARAYSLPHDNTIVTSALSFTHPNIHSTWLRGLGTRFASRITLNSSSAIPTFVVFGNGTFDQFHTGMSGLQIDGNELVSDAVVAFRRTNFSRFENVWLQGLGGRTGFKGRPGASSGFFQEVSFHNFSVMPEEGTQARGRIGVDIEATGNVDFWHANLEYLSTGLRFYGATSTAALTYIGGRFERINNTALDLDQCVARVVSDICEGAIRLGPGVINSDIESIGAAGGAFSTAYTAVVDNGFGNRVCRNQQLATSAFYDKALGSPGHQQRGDEWLRVPDLNIYPMMEDGVAGWTVTGFTTGNTGNPINVAPAGARGVLLKTNAVGNSIVRSLATPAATSDYLALVGITFDYASNGDFKVSLLDGADTELDSEIVSGYLGEDGVTNAQKAMFRLVKLGVSDFAAGTLKIKVESLSSSGQAVVWCAMVKRSILKHTTEVINSDSSAGSGFTKTYTRQLVTNPMVTRPTAVFEDGTGAIIRGVVETTSLIGGSVEPLLGLFGTSNDKASKGAMRLDNTIGTREYTMFAPSVSPGANQSAMQFYAYGTGDTIRLSRSGVYPVYAEVRRAEKTAQLTGPFSTSARVNLAGFGLSPKNLLNGQIMMVLNAANVGTSVDFWILRLRRRAGSGGSATDIWTVSNQSATWALGIISWTLTEADITGTNLMEKNEGLELELVKVNAAPDLNASISASVMVKEYLS